MTILFTYLPPIILAIAATAFTAGRLRSLKVAESAGGIRALHSLPSNYGVLTALTGLLPALVIYGLWLSLETAVVDARLINELPPALAAVAAGSGDQSLILNDIKNLLSDSVIVNRSPAIEQAAERYEQIRDSYRSVLTASVLLLSTVLSFLVYRRITPSLRARNLVEGIIRFLLLLCSGIAILTTLGIVLSVLFESIRFFKAIPLQEFLFGLNWSPQMAIRADQAGSSGAFGAVPIFAGTFMIAAIAMMVAIPIGLLSAIYLSEFANQTFRTVVKPLLEILAGIPTVVYGFFAALTVAPLIRDSGGLLGLSVASESALAAGLVMGIMIIPFVSSLSDDVIHAVPQSLRDGSYGLGATKFETVRYIIFPAALPGIVGGILLAVSRAVGETMIVVMAAGLAANLTANPFEAVTTVTVQIVTLLVGDQEFDSPKTLAAFALGLVLFVFTLILNVIALRVVRKYREHYE
ncbi:phosphate ABC transporter permease subunit PstC [Desulfofustis glycolicus]|uniref:Phosphate transport system permease protein n=1 Tax=Desulfofustis glycolicus DSM 9705 TaxID=1121409 RepID=A0A1M5V8V4_9BACT|nr:phosphate ABC transporter permease subunit PstC [Desulfofustis glycolicus]MCB2214896.1 phosphate ABC transporter permease subunit PstC [Desulfobulbaceae bacterium]SHH71655.1 phosphate ABC transporter membrane protein 1, PhoT family (TC 3.A.1.7.1) [Desulfofustis glycolicus DSM 9705]